MIAECRRLGVGKTTLLQILALASHRRTPDLRRPDLTRLGAGLSRHRNRNIASIQFHHLLATVTSLETSYAGPHLT